MKAIVYSQYGSPDVLQLKDVELPIPKDDEVLIKVHAASINDWDWGLLRGKPFMNRLLFGLPNPKSRILGSDIAGQIETVGSRVKLFQPGDDVFGDISGGSWGGYAEYVCARENSLAFKPVDMTFEEAAATPQAALLALQGLRDKRKVHSGQKVLINGAGGGTGTFAVQIARLFGAEVTGVDSTEKLDTMRSAGADHVIDFTREDFTGNGRHYDFILDLVLNRSVFNCKRALASGGIYVIVGGLTVRLSQAVILGPWISMIEGKKIVLLLHKPQAGDLDFIAELFEADKIKPVIDKCYPLAEVPEALRYFGEGHARGKIVITMGHDNNM